MIKCYQDFINESILITSPTFKQIVANVDHPIAKKFMSLIDKDSTETFNYINITDKNDTVSFNQDNQAKIKIQKGATQEELLNDLTNKTGVGRLVRKVLIENGINPTDKEIEQFNTLFKVEYENITKKVQPIRLIQGEEIKKWYFEDNYSVPQRGTLRNSCMKKIINQEFFSLYIKNPEVCKLLILTDEQTDLLLARALVWTTNDGLYLDRIYYSDESEIKKLNNWAKENLGIKYSFHGGTIPKLSIKLNWWIKEDDDFSFPYMDSFPYYNPYDGILANHQFEIKKYYYLQETNGGFEEIIRVYSDITGEWYPSNVAVYSNIEGTWIPDRSAEFSRYHDDYLYRPDAIYSPYFDEWFSITHKDCDLFNVQVWYDKWEYLPDYLEGVAFVERDGEYYSKDLLIVLTKWK